MGKRSVEGVQGELFLTSGDVPGSPGHAFYDRLNGLLAEAKFDGFVESQCRPHYEDPLKGGRPSLPPGNYFRMLFVGISRGSIRSGGSRGGVRTVCRCGRFWV